MEGAITAAVRKIVREEVQAAMGECVSARPSSRHVVEMPLRPGEVERQYPVVEVARLLGMSRDWVYDRIEDGTFVVANFGSGDKSKRRIPASSLNAYIKAHTYEAELPQKNRM